MAGIMSAVPVEALTQGNDFMSIGTQNSGLSPKCYNLRSVEPAIQRAKIRRNHGGAGKPNTAKDDRAAILDIAQARGCEELAKAWISGKMGNLQQFKDMLAARYQRLQRLFPNGAPIR